MLRKIGRSSFVRWAIGSLLAGYLRFVQRTNRLILIPANPYDAMEADQPVIITMWHGQHFMLTFFKKREHRCHVMISRHGDGEINAIAAQKLGMNVVRGSGAQRADQVRKRGGIQALRALIGLLESGENVSMTADVPKISRVAGDGIIALAQFSGRPIYPLAVVSSRRIDFASWDAASVGLPFGRTAIVTGAPIRLARHASPAEIEAARQQLEGELDRIQALGYGALGSKIPGDGRESVAIARQKRRDAATAQIARHAAPHKAD